MKKIDNNIFARSFKWVFLTLVLTAITSDKLFAQEKQNDTKSPGIVIQLGEEKQI
ncbi:MAG: hypothetical protein GX944_00635, partial [Alphaproteobacteria bacterium]|nr:hypothetical protein [Alphaproteobacteria bacterium]